jgi:transcriptional regulator with GAF, ATPase, and Fis domain
MTDPGSGPPSSVPEELDLEEVEKRTILRALEAHAWVQARAAKALGISRRALNYKIAKFGITHPSWRVHT